MTIRRKVWMMMVDNHHTLTDRHHPDGQGSDKMAVGDLVDLDENGEQTPSLIVVSPVAERVAPSAGAWTVAECPLQSLWQFVVAYQVPAGGTSVTIRRLERCPRR
jgi:hypothetical protein